jgi:hypothetical protein
VKGVNPVAAHAAGHGIGAGRVGVARGDDDVAGGDLGAQGACCLAAVDREEDLFGDRLADRISSRIVDYRKSAGYDRLDERRGRRGAIRKGGLDDREAAGA